MKIEIERIFDVAELFTGRVKTLIFPVDPVYIEQVLNESLFEIAPREEFSIKWTGKRYAIYKKERLFNKVNYASLEEVRTQAPDFYRIVSIINSAKLKCFMGQVPSKQL